MGNFFDEIQEDNQKNIEAMEHKAAEYKEMAAEIAHLKAKVTDLQANITSLQETIGAFNTTLQTIKPADLEKIKQQSTKVFEPLKKTAKDLNDDIKEAGDNALSALKAAGHEGIDWKGRIVSALFIALFFCMGQFAIQYHFAPGIDYARRMYWNLQMHNINSNLMVDFFDDEKDFEKVIENERMYKASQDLQNVQGEKKNQK